MTISISKKNLAGLAICLGALVFALGASSPDDSPPESKWAICAVAGSDGDAYLLNEQTGNLYYMSKRNTIGSKKVKLKLLGNVNEAE